MSKNRSVLHITLFVTLVILFLSGGAAAEIISEKNLCKDVVPMMAGETWNAHNHPGETAQCFNLYVPAPGILAIEVTAGSLERGTDHDFMTLERAATHRTIAFRQAGTYSVRLKAAGEYELRTDFLEARIENTELFLQSEAAGRGLSVTQSDFHVTDGSLLFRRIAIRPAGDFATVTKTDDDEEVDPDPAGIRTSPGDSDAIGVDLILFEDGGAEMLAKNDDDEEVDPDPAGIVYSRPRGGKFHGLVRVSSPLAAKNDDDEEVDPDPAGLRVGGLELARGLTRQITFSADPGSFSDAAARDALLERLVELFWPARTGEGAFRLHLYAPFEG